MLSMKSARLVFYAAVVCLILASCGGGGSGGSATVSDPDGPPTSSQEIRTLVQGVLDNSDTLLATKQHLFEAGDSPNFSIFRGIRTNCRGGTCSGVLPGGGALRLSDLAPNDEMTPFIIRNDIPIVTGNSVDMEQGLTADQHTFGSWLEHNVFFASTAKFYLGAVDPANFTGLWAGAVSFGNDTGSRPVSGSASWSGIMVGVEEDTFHDVHGDAKVTVDFESAEAGVAFTGIVYADTNVPLPSMTWSGLAIGTDGRFTGAAIARGVYTPGTEGHSIVGTFYGPNHEEVGGVFERDSIAGAFGASRGTR